MDRSPPGARRPAAASIAIAGALALAASAITAPVQATDSPPDQVAPSPAAFHAPSPTAFHAASLDDALPGMIEAMALARRKCPLIWNEFPDAPLSGVVVDGVLVAEGHAAVSSLMVPGASAPGAEHAWGRILEARLMCGEDLYNRTGIAVRNHAFVIHTEEGPVAPVITLLSELAERQQAHFEAHGRFAAALDDLDWAPEGGTRSVTISLSDEALGWTAIAAVEGYPATCGIFGGTAEPLANRAPENRPLCPVARD